MDIKEQPDIITDMNVFVAGVAPNATIRGLLINSQKNQPKSGGKNFFLTDLCNPLQFS